MLTFDDHPRLHPAAFSTRFPAPLGELDYEQVLRPFRGLEAAAPVARSEEKRAAVRALLRYGSYKPTGRGKPSSEYLFKAASEAELPTINAAVDTCNVVSLASGLPISVVDLDRVVSPLRVGIAQGSYVFNASGQEIKVDDLLCLIDVEGPCANAVKDSQRTKTSPDTTHTLSILWGPASFADEVEAALAWYCELLGAIGATTERA